jgi:hypothetical protein
LASSDENQHEGGRMKGLQVIEAFTTLGLSAVIVIENFLVFTSAFRLHPSSFLFIATAKDRRLRFV